MGAILIVALGNLDWAVEWRCLTACWSVAFEPAFTSPSPTEMRTCVVVVEGVASRLIKADM